MLATLGYDSLGRLTGLWASDLLLLQVLLMARIPLAERAFGQDRLARWHRWTGFTSFWLMVAHIVLITLGYAGTDRANAFRELWDIEVVPGEAVNSPAGLWDFARTTGGTVFHACGTCRMGSDENAVVDPRLRVRGVEKLRVIDASSETSDE